MGKIIKAKGVVPPKKNSPPSGKSSTLPKIRSWLNIKNLFCKTAKEPSVETAEKNKQNYCEQAEFADSTENLIEDDYETVEEDFSDLQCSTCHELFVQPVTLCPCSHVFCGACISEWLTKCYKEWVHRENGPLRDGNPSQMSRCTCPLCRGVPKSVHKNVFAAQLVEKAIEAGVKARPKREIEAAIKKDLFYKNGVTIFPRRCFPNVIIKTHPIPPRTRLEPRPRIGAIAGPSSTVSPLDQSHLGLSPALFGVNDNWNGANDTWNGARSGASSDARFGANDNWNGARSGANSDARFRANDNRNGARSGAMNAMLGANRSADNWVGNPAENWRDILTDSPNVEEVVEGWSRSLARNWYNPAEMRDGHDEELLALIRSFSGANIAENGANTPVGTGATGNTLNAL